MNYIWLALFLAFLGFEAYSMANRPICREGFVAVTSFGVGWYCGAGYNPQ